MQKPTVLPVANGSVIRAYEDAGVKVSAAQLPEYIILPRMSGYGSINVSWQSDYPYPVEVTSFALVEGKNNDITGWQRPKNAVIQITDKDGGPIGFFRDVDSLNGAVIPSGGKIQIEINNSTNFDYIDVEVVTLKRCAIVAIEAWSDS